MPTRADYLNALLSQKRNNAQYGNFLVNPSTQQQQTATVSNPNVNVDSSNGANWGAFDWLRQGIGYVGDFFGSIDTGARKAFEGVGDLLLTGVSAIGEAAGNDMSSLNDFISQDISTSMTNWEKSYNTLTALENIGNGDYWNNAVQDYGKMFYDTKKVSEDESKYNGFKVKQTEASQFINGVGQTIGQILPAVALGDLGGAGSALSKAATIGFSGLSSAGNSSESALNDGANATGALGYGAIKGTLAAAQTAAFGLIGSKVGAVSNITGKLEGKVSSYLLNQGYSEFSSALLAKSSTMALKVAGDSGLAATQQAIDPLIKQITYDGDAINKAYGSSEATDATLKSIGSAALVSALTSATMQAVRTKVDIDTLGKDGYTAKFNMEQEQMYADKANKSLNQLHTLINDGASKEQIDAKMMEANDFYKKAMDYDSKLNIWQKTLKFDEKGNFIGNEQTANLNKQANAVGGSLQGLSAKAKADALYSFIKRGNISESAYTTGDTIYESKDEGWKFYKASDTENSYYYQSQEGRKVPLLAIGDTMVYAPKTTDVAVAIENLTNDNDIPSSTLKLPLAESKAISSMISNDDTKPVTISKAVINNAKDDGMTIKQITMALPKSEGEVTTFRDDEGNLVMLNPDKVGVDGNVAVLHVSDRNEDISLLSIERVSQEKAKQMASTMKPLVKTQSEIVSDSKMATPNAFIADHANLKHSLVYEKKDVDSLLSNIKQSLEKRVSEISGNQSSLTLGDGLAKTEDLIFKGLNTETKYTDLRKFVVDKIMSSTVREMERDASGKLVNAKGNPGSPLTDYLTEDEAKALETSLSNDMDALVDYDGKQSTMSKVVEKLTSEIEKAVFNAKEYKSRINPNRVVSKNIKRLVTKYGRDDLTFSNKDMLNHGAALEVNPLKYIEHTNLGMNAKQDFLDSAKDFLSKYDENTWANQQLPFNQALKDRYQQLVDSIVPNIDKNGDRSFPSFTSSQIQLVKDITKIVTNQVREATIKVNTEIKPSAYALSEALKVKYPSQTKIGFARDLFRKYSRNNLHMSDALTSMMGDNAYTRELGSGIDQAVDKQLLDTGTHYDDFKKVLEANNFKDGAWVKAWNKPIALSGGETMPIWVAENILSGANCGDESKNLACIKQGIYYNEINKNGSNGVLKHIPYREGLIDDIKAALPLEVKNVGDYISKDYNNDKDGGLKGDYSRMYLDNYGVDDNTVDTIYAPLSEYSGTGNLAGGKVIDVRPFHNKQSRTESVLPYYARPSIGTYKKYIEDLYIVKDVKPIVAKLASVLSTPINDGGETVQTMLDKVDPNITGLLKDYFHVTLGINFENGKAGLLSKLVNHWSVATLGFNISSYLQQGLAEFTNPAVRSGTYLKHNVQAVFHAYAPDEAFKDTKQALMEHFASVKYRQSNSEAALSLTNKSRLNKAQEIYLWALGFGDAKEVDTSIDLLTYQGQALGYGKRGTQGNIQYVIDNALGMMKYQNNSTRQQVSLMRAGKFGETAKSLFGNLQSSNQAIASWFLKLSTQITQYSNYDAKGMAEKENLAKSNYDSLKAISDEKEAEVANIEKDLDSDNPTFSKDDYIKASRDNEKAQDDTAKAKGQYDYYKNQNSNYDEYSKAGGTRTKVRDLAVGLIIIGLGSSLVHQLMQRIYGREEWNEFDYQSFAKDVAINTFANWVPVANTIVGWVEGYDIAIPSLTALTDIRDGFVSALNYMQNPTEANRAAMFRGIATAGEMAIGFPATNLYKVMHGILYQFDPKDAIALNNIFYNATSKETATMNGYIKSGDDAKATAYLNSIMGERVGAISSEEQKELISLMKDGQSVLPSSVPDTYSKDDGEDVTITWTQKQQIKSYYAKANALVSKMIQTAMYKSLSNELKASAIKAVYSSYKEAGMSKAISGLAAKSKKAILAKAGFDMASIIPAVYYINALQATKSQTRKELALTYVNKLSLSKQDKLVVLILAGFNVSSSSTLNSYLRSKGLSKAEVESFLK